MNERDLRMGMEQSKAMEYESRKASSDVLKPRNIYIYIILIFEGLTSVSNGLIHLKILGIYRF
jgi:hypothetical protein